MWGFRPLRPAAIPVEAFSVGACVPLAAWVLLGRFMA